MRNEFSWKEIIKSGKNYFISGAVMFLLLIFVGARLSSSIINTLLMIILGGAVYFALLLLLKDEFLLSNIKSILIKLGKSNE